MAPHCSSTLDYAVNIYDEKVKMIIQPLAYLEMIQEHGVQPRVGGPIGIKENHRISLHERSDVEDVDLEKPLDTLRS